MSLSPLPSPSPSPVNAPLWLTRASLGALLAGLFSGEAVQGIAAQQQGSVFGLVAAMIFLVSGSMSVLLFLLSSPAAAPHPRAACVQAWLLAQGVGVLISLPWPTLA